MTLTELSTDIDRLQQKADEAREDGNDSLLYRTLVLIDELAEEMGVQAARVRRRLRMKEALSAAYVQLLKYHGPERVTPKYQKLLSDCRDALAAECGTSAEAMQNAHESKARGER